jgi:competence ComEA-like helix-hairpin-helix protein
LLWASPAVQAHDAWVTLKDCHYILNPADDGDSFHVRVGAKEYIFRLYFVDAPETDAGLVERVAEQAKYFGVKPSQAIKLGELAKDFTREKLSRPFVVQTCMQDALGRSKMERFYAFVQTDSGDLGEELVANGLARLHGTTTHPPAGGSPQREWQKLVRLEREAKQQKVGGWGANSGRINARLPRPIGANTAEKSFNAFFHPEQTPTPTASPAVAAVATSGAIGTAGAKLNVNTASEEQLEELPGVGETIAARIIAARPFATADDLRNVKGVGPVKYEKIRPFFE